MAAVRLPAVAGAFYPADRARLVESIGGLLPRERAPLPAIGALVPHAGYIYSGACAATTLAGVTIPASVLLLGPNHTGRGAALAAAPEQAWLTPLGKVEIDRGLLDRLVAVDPEVRLDERAHASEHCLEVVVPLLQTLRPDVAIAPVVVGTHDLTHLRRLGEAIAEVAVSRTAAPLVVVSSDMTHYEPAERARVRDEKALAYLERLDADGLLEVTAREGITMCGVAPAAAALVAFAALGARAGRLVAYAHSGEVTGDDRDVVSYAGMVFA